MPRYGGCVPLCRHVATFWLGYLAIIGVPPFGGLFLQAAIIEAALGQEESRYVLSRPRCWARSPRST